MRTNQASKQTKARTALSNGLRKVLATVLRPSLSRYLHASNKHPTHWSGLACPYVQRLLIKTVGSYELDELFIAMPVREQHLEDLQPCA
jgi:hypothetical protein